MKFHIAIGALAFAQAVPPAFAQSYEPLTGNVVDAFSGIWVKADIPAAPDAAALALAAEACGSPRDLYDSSYLEGDLQTVAMTNMRKMTDEVPGIEKAAGDLFFLPRGDNLVMATESWFGFWPDVVTLFRYGRQEKGGGMVYTLHKDKAWESDAWEKQSGTEVFLLRTGKDSTGTDIAFMAYPYDAWAGDPWGDAGHYVKCG